MRARKEREAVRKRMERKGEKWSTAKVTIALKTYALHFCNILENH
jgi:hypothetical protein